MTRRPATFTETDARRAIAAFAKATGCTRPELVIHPGGEIRVREATDNRQEAHLDASREIKL